MVNPEVTARAFRAMEQLVARYGAHPSFYGWYYPDETCITRYFDENFAAYVNRYSAFSHSLDPKLKTMIAPYGTNRLSADDEYVRQLERLDVDIVAYRAGAQRLFELLARAVHVVEQVHLRDAVEHGRLLARARAQVDFLHVVGARVLDCTFIAAQSRPLGSIFGTEHSPATLARNTCALAAYIP